MSGPIIITATNVDHKLVNRLLLHLRDWEYREEGTWDRFTIVRNNDDIDHSVDRKIAVPPVQEFDNNEFAGWSIVEVDRMTISKSDNGLGMGMFLLLDDQGVQDKTIIIAERALSESDAPDANPFDMKRNNKARVPWDEVSVMWSNLENANLYFHEFCDEDEDGPKTADGWYTYFSPSIRNDKERAEKDEIVQKRTAVIHELEKLDLA